MCLEGAPPSWCGPEETYAAAKWARSLDLPLLALHGFQRVHATLPADSNRRTHVEVKLLGLAQLAGDYSVAEFLAEPHDAPSNLLNGAVAWAHCRGPLEEVEQYEVTPIGWQGLVWEEEEGLQALGATDWLEPAAVNALRERHEELARSAPKGALRTRFEDRCGPEGSPPSATAPAKSEQPIEPWSGYPSRWMVAASQRTQVQREQTFLEHSHCLEAPSSCNLGDAVAVAIDAFWLGLPTAALFVLEERPAPPAVREPYLLLLSQQTRDDRLLHVFTETEPDRTPLPEAYAWARCEEPRSALPGLYTGAPTSWKELRAREKSTLRLLRERRLPPAVRRDARRALRRGRQKLRSLKAPRSSCVTE